MARFSLVSTYSLGSVLVDVVLVKKLIWVLPILLTSCAWISGLSHARIWVDVNGDRAAYRLVTPDGASHDLPFTGEISVTRIAAEGTGELGESKDYSALIKICSSTQILSYCELLFYDSTKGGAHTALLLSWKPHAGGSWSVETRSMPNRLRSIRDCIVWTPDPDSL